MGLTLSAAARNARADATADLVDVGAGAGRLDIYSGTRPAGPDVAVTDQTLLASVTLNDPAFGSAVAGVVTLDADPALSGTGVAAGEATWARLCDSDGTAIIDLDVTATGGGGDLTLATTTVSVGLTVIITSGTLTEPAGTA